MDTAKMKNLIDRFVRDESGATAVEYAVLAALITGAIIVAVGNVGTKLNNAFTNISNQLPG